MGTHNRLLRLGKALYLEVIAINPDADKPDRPRWFDMDNVGNNANPLLATWVARTNDIRSAASVSPHFVGNIEPMNRGNFQWLISIPADGSLPFEGVAPTLIERTSKTHPASSLADDGCSLVRLEGYHSQAVNIAEMLRVINFQDEFNLIPLPPGASPYLTAQILTPSGIRQLGTH